jgi:O-antigen/teichoic acid export membrane protein
VTILAHEVRPDARTPRWDARSFGLASATGLLRVVIGAVLFFVGVPLLLARLGADRYGVWVLVTTITAWLQFADFGLRTAIVRATARSSALDDAAARDVANAVVGHSSAAYSLVVVLLVAGGIVLVPFVARTIFGLPERLLSDAIFVLRLGVTAFAVDLLSFGLFRGVLDGTGRVSVSNLVAIAHTALRWTAVITAALATGSLTTMALAALGASSTMLVVWFLCVRSVGRRPRLTPRMPRRGELRELLGFAGFVQVNDIITAVTPQLVEIIVLRRLGLGALAVFDIGIQLSIHVRVALNALWSPLMPLLSGVHASEPRKTRMVAALSRRLMNAVVTIGTGLVVIAGPALVAVWISGQSATTAVDMIALVVMGLLLGSVASHVFLWNAVGTPQKTTKVLAAYSVVFVAGALIGVAWGLPAVAWAGLAAACVAVVVADIQMVPSVVESGGSSLVGAAALPLALGIAVVATTAGAQWVGFVTGLVVLIAGIGEAAASVGQLRTYAWQA